MRSVCWCRQSAQLLTRCAVVNFRNRELTQLYFLPKRLRVVRCVSSYLTTARSERTLCTITTRTRALLRLIARVYVLLYTYTLQGMLDGPCCSMANGGRAWCKEMRAKRLLEKQHPKPKIERAPRRVISVRTPPSASLLLCNTPTLKSHPIHSVRMVKRLRACLSRDQFRFRHWRQRGHRRPGLCRSS